MHAHEQHRELCRAALERLAQDYIAQARALPAGQVLRSPLVRELAEIVKARLPADVRDRVVFPALP